MNLRKRRKGGVLGADRQGIGVAGAVRMASMARLVEADVAAQVVDAAAGGDGGFVDGGSVAARAKGECLRERRLSATDGPAHVGADFRHFVAEEGDVWWPGEDRRDESREEEEDSCVGHCVKQMVGLALGGDNRY